MSHDHYSKGQNHPLLLSHERRMERDKRREEMTDRAIRLARRDLAYDALHTPVTVSKSGTRIIEWRGQPRLGCRASKRC